MKNVIVKINLTKKFIELKFLAGNYQDIIQHIALQISNKSTFSYLPCSLNDIAQIANSSSSASYQAIDCFLPDGMPLVWWLKYIRGKNTERIYGPDLMEDVITQTQSLKIRHFFYGSSLTVLEKLQRQLTKKNPNLKIAGILAPPYPAFSTHDKENLFQQLRLSKATVLWIGISSPKQVEIASQIRVDFPDLTIFCVGAAFNINSQPKLRAPNSLQKSGLEWLYRLIQEPKRLSYRYLIFIPTALIKLFFRNLKISFV